MLRSEYGTMKLIQESTKCLIPEVLAYDDRLENDLGAPFIITRACPGVPANQIWFDQRTDGKDDFESVDTPSNDCKRLRENFLQSLAWEMSKLQALDFDKIGALDFKNPRTDLVYQIGSYWREHTDRNMIEDDLQTDEVLKEQPMRGSSHDLFMLALEAEYSDDGPKTVVERVTYEVLEALYRCPPFTSPTRVGETNETFVLRHDDLSFQSILCDPDTGKVTAILDWERCTTAPRCIGFASLPTLLISDWSPNPASSYPIASNKIELLDIYRNVYAKAMLTATGAGGDGMCTAESAIYQAAYAAIRGGSAGGDKHGFVRLIVQDILELPDFDQVDWLDWLEKNWVKYGAVVKGRLAKAVAADATDAAEQ